MLDRGMQGGKRSKVERPNIEKARWKRSDRSINKHERG